MENLNGFVFLPLTICLMVIAFHEELRNRILAVKAVAYAEKKLTGFQQYYWPAFAIIMLAGIFVRCYRFIELPMGVNQDGLMAGVEAYCLLMDGTDQYGTSWPTYFRAWSFSQMSTLYSYLLIPFIRVLGLSKFTLRLPMLLISIAVLPIVWDLARRILGKGYALMALLVAATNPWQILQSRWALEANLMPHIMLMGIYLLCIGRNRRWALYLSMLFFGLTPYAYGVACFSVAVLLIAAAVYYVARKKAGVLDVILCILIFVGVAGPYFYTMVINAFGMETVQIGAITMPYFEESLRSRDMVFSKDNPYLAMLKNLFGHLGTYLYKGYEADYNVIPWAHSMYIFMSPLIAYGLYRLWRDRRNMDAAGVCGLQRDGLMLILIWYGAAVFNGIMVGSVVNRNNVVFYPLILMCAYVLYQMGKRMRSALAAMMTMILVSFVGLNVTYFTDESYQRSVGAYFHNGLQQALVDTWDWDYDHYYLTTEGARDRETFMAASAMFAHQIDFSARNEDTDLIGPDGQPSDWYFSERYILKDYSEYAECPPDPMDCAVYIMRQEEKRYFDSDEYLMTDYDRFAVAYPRYWAE